MMYTSSLIVLNPSDADAEKKRHAAKTREGTFSRGGSGGGVTKLSVRGYGS